MAGLHDPYRPLNKQSVRPASPPPTPPQPHASTSSQPSPSHLTSSWHPNMNDPSSSSSSCSSPHGFSSSSGSRSPRHENAGQRYPIPSQLGLISDDDIGDGYDRDGLRERPFSPQSETSPPNLYRSQGSSRSGRPSHQAPTARLAFNAPDTPGDLDRRRTDSKSRSDNPYQTSGPYSRPSSASPGPAREGPEWMDSEAAWLALYFCFNLGLTLFNKIVLVSFPFPYTLTGLHALSGCAGCYVALERGSFTPAHLTSRDTLVLAAFSVLYTINIAVSNLSLQLVTVPFHQVVRAATPLFTILISVVVLRASFTRTKILSLLPVIAGVGLATYGDYYFTLWGLILTLIGTGLAALKTVVTNQIQTGGGGRLRLHPLDLLMRMSPLAFIQCVMYAWYTGELERVRKYGAKEMTGTKAVGLLVNGVIAFGLNVVSFTANKKTSALTMTVAANVKQVLTIVLAVIIFNLTISPTNMLGILLTLGGGAGYAYIEYREKQEKAARRRSF